MKNEFLNFVGKHFNEIKTNFKKQIEKLGFKFDHDVFYDTMLKCNNKFVDITDCNDEIVNYFWVAFKMNTLREFKYSRNKFREEESAITEDMLTTEKCCFDEDDYEEISNLIIDKFGVDLYKLFSLHANGVKYSELIKTTKIDELKYKFRQIREYVRKEFKKG